MSAVLHLRVMGEPGRSHPLPGKGKVVVGSSADLSGLVLSAPGVDDAHCAIGRVKTGGWAIKDLGSQHGVFVNGEKVSTALLSAGDEIVLGGERLVVFDPEAEEVEVVELGDEAEIVLEEVAAEPRLGGFKIERKLGRGGMGEVLLAVQESLHRHVALKVLNEELAQDQEFVRRFNSEARAAAALSHPNVVVVYDVGQAEGRHFLAMEYMPGGNLEERVAREGRLPWREVLDVLHDAAAGLTYAEAQGIVHRDIKPANLMIAASGAIKIADLGLATPVASQDEEQKTFGTPHFVSPEQARGQTVSHKSDLYSLGATAYRLLTGRTPFEGSTAREIVRARFTETPPPPRRFVPGIPPELEDLVLALMEVDPANRPASAENLLRAVDKLRLHADHGVPAEAAPLEPQRNRRIGLALALIVVLVGATAFLLWPRDEPIRPTPADSGGATAQAVGTNDPLDDDFFDPEDEGSTGAGGADEKALEVLELQAQLAYRDIPAGLEPLERAAELEDLAEEFRETNVAREAREEAQAIRARESDTASRDAAHDRAVEEALGRLSAAAGWPPATDDGSAVPLVGEIVASIQGYQVSTGMQLDPKFVERREALVSDVTTTALERGRAQLARAEALAEEGDFETLRTNLEALAPRLSLPEPTPGEPAGFDELRTLASDVATRLERLDVDARTFRREQERSDAAALGAAFGPASAFPREVERLSIRASVARLEPLLDAYATDEARTLHADLLTRLARAGSALSMLVDEFPNWRRETVMVPSGRRPEAVQAVGADADGIQVIGDSGRETVPWGVIARDVETFAALFRGRLERSFTLEEERAILSLLTLSAANDAARRMSPVIDPTRRGLFGPSEAAAMRHAFDGAIAWRDENPGVEYGEAAEDLEREIAAAAVLSDAALAATEGAWTRAVSALRYALSDHADTFVVRLLADGVRED